MSLTFVTAVLAARKGCEESLKAELLKVVPMVRAEEGCVRYDLHVAEQGGKFLFYEIWESPAHLAAHAKTAHMAAMHEATRDLADGDSVVDLWQGVDAGN